MICFKYFLAVYLDRGYLSWCCYPRYGWTPLDNYCILPEYYLSYYLLNAIITIFYLFTLFIFIYFYSLTSSAQFIEILSRTNNKLLFQSYYRSVIKYISFIHIRILCCIHIFMLCTNTYNIKVIYKKQSLYLLFFIIIKK